MKIFPAIDIRGGQVVRLTQGDYENMTVYSSDPSQIASQFLSSGAEYLHTVDLDGAKDGKLCNFEVIKKLAEHSGLSVEVGGGIRDEERIDTYLSVGIKRVILGSVSVENPNFVGEMTKKYGDKIAVGVDAIKNRVAIHGWKTVTDFDSVDFCRFMYEKMNVSTIVYTDISKDGMLSGTNLEIYKKLSEIKGLQIIASGGITYIEEIRKLASANVYGAILGKSIYAGKIDLAQAIQVAKGVDG